MGGNRQGGKCAKVRTKKEFINTITRAKKMLHRRPQSAIINIRQTEYRSTPDGGCAGRKTDT